MFLNYCILMKLNVKYEIGNPIEMTPNLEKIDNDKLIFSFVSYAPLVPFLEGGHTSWYSRLTPVCAFKDHS